MNIFKYSTGNDNAGFTVIENIFINEYMPVAKGDYVKVYLFGLKNSQNPDLQPLSTGEMARILDLTEADILKAYDYWEEQKLIRVRDSGADRQIEFLNIGSMLHYPQEKSAGKIASSKVSDKKFKWMIDTVQTMFGGEPITHSYLKTFEDWMDIYGFDPETVVLLVEYALNSMDKNNRVYRKGSRLRYMEKVAETWRKAGVRDYRQANALMESQRENSRLVYAVLDEMRLSGKASRSDFDQVQAWKDLGFDDEMILEAVKRAGTKKFSYITSMLKNWKAEGITTISDLEARDASGSAILPLVYQVLRQMHLSGNPTDSEIETIGKWRDEMGFSDEMILEAAKRSSGKNLKYASTILANWKNQGIRTLSEAENERKRRPSASSAGATRNGLRPESVRNYEEGATFEFDPILGDDDE